MVNWGSLPDDSFVGVTTTGTVWRWSGEGVRDDAPLASGGGRSLRTSPGTWLVPDNTLDGEIAVVDAQTGNEVFSAPGLGGVVFPAIGPDDRHLLVLDTDGQATLDLEQGVEIGPLTDGSPGPTRARPVFPADGASVWLATGDSWRRYPLDPTWWRDRAGRDLTEAEWTEFVSASDPPQPICE